MLWRMRNSRSGPLLSILFGHLLPTTLAAQSTVVPTSIVSAAAPSSTSSPNTLSTIPECTRSCLTSATLAQPCLATDTQCLCAHSKSIRDHTLSCLTGSTCSKAEISLTANYYDSLCVSLGYPLTASPGEIFGTATGTSGAATGSDAGSTVASSTGTTSQDGSSNNSTTKISIIAGAAIGVALLLILTLLTGFWLLNRRRRKDREEREKEFTYRPPTTEPSVNGDMPRTASSLYSPTLAAYKAASSTKIPTRRSLHISPSPPATSLLPAYSPRMSKQLYIPSSSSNPALAVNRSNTTKSANTVRTNNTDVTFTMVTKSDLSPTSAFPPYPIDSTLPPSTSQDAQNSNRPTVREIEIRRPNPSPLPPAAKRVVSTLGQLVQEDDDDDDDYTSVSSSGLKKDSPNHLGRSRSLQSSQHNSPNPSPSLHPMPLTTHPTHSKLQPLSPGLSQFDFGLAHSSAPDHTPDTATGTPSNGSPGDQGSVQGNRHFV